MNDEKRIVFLDWLRVVACFMVMVIHSCEPFYLGGAEPNVTFIESGWDMLWVTVTECLCRCCVPLFAMTSAYLLFPVKRPTGEFFRRRIMRVFVPFAIWAVLYVAWFGKGAGAWGKLCFNFPDEGGHLWFVPMIFGLYILMPLLSPWAEKVEARELKGWLTLWLATAAFPFVRSYWGHLFGDPSFGAVPYLWGECPWNHFGAFHYVSGFIGYMLLGFWFRRFAPEFSWRRTLAVSVPLWLAGAAIMGGGFYFRIPEFPCAKPYAFAVDLEMSIEYCSTGVAVAVIAAFMLIRKITADGAFYRWIVRPLSEASYGTYLLHMFVLLAVFDAVRPHCNTPATIFVTAVVSYVIASAVGVLIRRIPFVGKLIGG